MIRGLIYNRVESGAPEKRNEMASNNANTGMRIERKVRVLVYSFDKSNVLLQTYVSLGN